MTFSGVAKFGLGLMSAALLGHADAYACTHARNKLKGNQSTHLCDTPNTAGTGYICADNDCCELDNTKCSLGYTTACVAGKYKDHDATGTTVAICCKTAAACSTYTCPTGYTDSTAKSKSYCVGATCTAVGC